MGSMWKQRKIGWNIWFWIGAMFFFLTGIVGIIFALFPDIEPIVEKESLQTKEVTIAELDYHIGYRSANTYYIRTTEGEKYIISGSFQRTELVEMVTSGKTVVVKWHRGRFPSAQLAEEMFADGKQVVFYNNDQKTDRKVLLFLGCLVILMGMGCIAALRYDKKLGMEPRKRRNGKTAAKHRKRNTL